MSTNLEHEGPKPKNKIDLKAEKGRKDNTNESLVRLYLFLGGASNLLTGSESEPYPLIWHTTQFDRVRYSTKLVNYMIMSLSFSTIEYERRQCT